MKILKIIFTAVSPIIFYLIIGLIALNGNHKWLLLLMSIFYFIIGFYSRTKKQVFIFSIPFLLLMTSTLFLKNALTSIILFYLIIIPTSILFGYLTQKKSKTFSLLFILFIVFIFYYGFDNLNSFIRNYNVRVNDKSPKIELLSNSDKLIKLDTIKNKVIVLDFWTTSCGVCFKKFPDYEKVYLEYENNPNVAIFSVNVPIKRDTLIKTKELVKELGYKFPTLYASSNEISQSLSFNLYPHLTILKNGRVRYNGRLEIAENVKINNLRIEIERLLNE
ncbi:TlpA disulfide reductase family protein [uncultured Lutibacter sp.]|uniref:TlpA family protein disulfide reductase n=1 Tax=uncultured Lutibacter sp. TaxID=437739 RepID=UPI0026329732|nr:TlpA disulfide reductase family protein [uncultured Lutibacter sp.]